MKILLSNDDGVSARGLCVMREALMGIAADVAVEVIIVAPRENCSGYSNALSLRKRIEVQRLPGDVYAVAGTPADCVHLAVNGMLDFAPDIVISGINHGGNLGDDVVYSGTVAAATEGRFLRLPAIAVSLVGQEHRYFETAARVVLEKLEKLLTNPFNAKYLLNINVPDLPYDELAGVEITRCGYRNHAKPIIHEGEGGKSGDKLCFRIGQLGAPGDFGEGTDFYAIKHNRVSITPITMDMTDKDKIAHLASWWIAGG